MERREVILNPHIMRCTKRVEPDDGLVIIKGIHKSILCVPITFYTKSV